MKPELKYGLIAGAAACLWMLAEFALGLHTRHLWLWEYTDTASSVVFVPPLWLLLKLRMEALPPGAALPLRTALLSSLLMGLVAALVIYVFMVGYTFFINPGWVDTVLAWKVAAWRAAGEAEPAIRQQITVYRRLHSPAGMAAMLLVNTPLLTAILSVFLAVWLNLRSRRAC